MFRSLTSPGTSPGAGSACSGLNQKTCIIGGVQADGDTGTHSLDTHAAPEPARPPTQDYKAGAAGSGMIIVPEMDDPTVKPRYNPWLDGGEPDPNPEPEPDPPWARIDPVLVHAAQENSIFRIMRRPKAISDL